MEEIATIHYHYKTPLEVAKANMPFLKRGGLFIPTSEGFGLGDKLECHLALVNEEHLITAVVEVVWIAPPGMAGYHNIAGVGVMFDEKDTKVFSKLIGDILEDVEVLDKENSDTFGIIKPDSG